MKKIILIALLGIGIQAFGQETFPVNGVDDERPDTYALTNATIYVDYQTSMENATLLIENGKVVAAGTSIQIPKGAIIHDLEGKYIYPAFIDPYASYGLPEVKRGGGGWGSPPQYQSKKEGAYGWNQAVKAEYDALEEFKHDAKTAEKLRKNGFGAVLSFRPDGVVRGTGSLVVTADAPEQELVVLPKASFHFSFDKGSSTQNYPSSIMGMVALIRQTYYDAEWYANGGNSEQVNISLQSFNDTRNLPRFFEANGGKLRVLLADKIGDEFNERFIIKGNGDEYQRADEIKATNTSLIIPLDFPAAFDVEDPIAALDVSLEDLKHWELAPKNPAILAAKNIEFAFTADGLKDHGDYLMNIRKAVKYGLSKEEAIKAMTYTPARLVNAQNQLGSLQKGRLANFIITSGDLFEDDTKVHQTWVKGMQYEISPLEKFNLTGTYDLNVGSDSYEIEVSSDSKAKIKLTDSTSLEVSMKVDGQAVSLSYTPEDQNIVRLSGWIVGEEMKGNGKDADGNWVQWSMKNRQPLESDESEKSEEEEEDVPEVGDIIYPFVAYGWKEDPKQESILFKNATVWTMDGDDDKLENTDVLVETGKIAKIGKNLSASGAKEIDAEGMHLTPGIIDEHSHIALSGVNEGSNAITSEVRMYDAIDSEDIDIYRQLSGGVVAAQLLHGSANPVGGQSALIKFRWGKAPQELRIDGADEYIKFALGENVKQSNWGDQNTIRFPQTRMGVEQVYMNAFTKAKEYDQEWKKYNGLSNRDKASATAPRKDLQLEALAEIINSERFVTCHSYVQSEINMLMKVAEYFDFNVNTFTHILEGYKVADKMAEHGVGGSTFSDWWAYKYEVREAIPYNAALMHQAGVTVAINSDDGEMARRLNQEAAKTIKFGGMSEIEAMKMVTINPAKLLHIDDKTGSIEVGKDADLVLWTDHPLSVYAKAKMTMIEGVVYFDLEKDREMRDQIREERVRLINKMKGVKKAGGKTQKYRPKERHRWDCEEFVIEVND